MIRVQIREREGYYLTPETHIDDGHLAPAVGEVTPETLERWRAVQSQWKALQIELQAFSTQWDREAWERENP